MIAPGHPTNSELGASGGEGGLRDCAPGRPLSDPKLPAGQSPRATESHLGFDEAPVAENFIRSGKENSDGRGVLKSEPAAGPRPRGSGDLMQGNDIAGDRGRDGSDDANGGFSQYVLNGAGGADKGQQVWGGAGAARPIADSQTDRLLGPLFAGSGAAGGGFRRVRASNRYDSPAVSRVEIAFFVCAAHPAARWAGQAGVCFSMLTPSPCCPPWSRLQANTTYIDPRAPQVPCCECTRQRQRQRQSGHTRAVPVVEPRTLIASVPSCSPRDFDLLASPSLWSVSVSAK